MRRDDRATVVKGAADPPSEAGRVALEPVAFKAVEDSMPVDALPAHAG